MDQNGAQLLRDKVAVLGSNARVKVVVTDGFVYRSLVGEAGRSTVEGIVGTSPSSPSDRLTGAAGRFVDAFGNAEGDVHVYGFTIYAAAATQVLLDAIARSDGTRKDVVAKLFATDRREDRDRADVVRRQRRPEGGQRGAVQGPERQLGLSRPPVLRVAGQAGPRGGDDEAGPLAQDVASRPTTSTTRRTFRAQRASPARASCRRGSPTRRTRSARTSARRRPSTSRAGAARTGRGSRTTTTSTRPSASGWATCRTGCTSRRRRAGASRR